MFFDLNFFCSVFLIFSSIGSILVGCIGGLFQNNIKRLFGYASINQLGFLLAGLSVSSYFSFRITIFYFFIYILVASVFLFIVSSSYNESTGKVIQYNSELKSLPGLASKVSSVFPPHVAFLVSIFSMCGLPPLAGFFAKYLLMLQIMHGGQFLMVLFILLGSAISAFYYLKLVFQLVSYDSDEPKGDSLRDEYSFEFGYELKSYYFLETYPTLYIIDAGTFIVVYMPLFFLELDVFSVIDFFLLSVYA